MLRPAVPSWVRQSGKRVLERLGLRQPPLLKPTAIFHTLSPETVPAIERALRRIKEAGPRGDYYEFGLFRGYTFCFAQKAARAIGLSDMAFFGFDSFKGLPKPNGVDALTADFRQGDYACTFEQVRSNLLVHGVDWSSTHLIEGYYEDSLTRELKRSLGLRPAALVLIDCDLYHSTVKVVEFMEELFQEGTVLLFDDWNCFNRSDEMGERRAMREFLARNTGWHAEPLFDFGWHGQAFVMKKICQGSNAEHGAAP